MKYLKKVQNVEEYNTFIVSSAFTLPNVTKIVNAGGGNYDVKYNPKEEGNYLWFFALGEGDISFTIPANNPSANFPYISYSTDNGENWTTETHSDGVETVATVHLSAAGSVMFKAECVSGTNWNSAGTEDSSYPARFSSTMPVNLGGNLASLMYGDDFEGKKTMKVTATHAFFKLFSEMDIVHAKNLCLPYTTLNLGIYQRLFSKCKKLVDAPQLNATTIYQQCYVRMFEYCDSLVIPPTLPAKKGAKSGYTRMFEGCVSLVNAPSIELTTTGGSAVCTMMFKGCSSLQSSPELKITSLGTAAYNYMFSGCSSLNYVKALFTTTPGTGTTKGWLTGVTQNGTFVKNSSATWDGSITRGAHTVPENWTITT